MMRYLALATIWSALSLAAAHAGMKETAARGEYIIQDESVREDIGNIREVNREPFQPTYRSRVTTSATFTSNSELLGDHDSPDFLVSPLIEGGVNIPLGHGFDLDLVARLEAAAYSARSSNSFFGVSGAATLSYRYNSKVPRLFIGAEPYSYWQFDLDRVSSAVALTAGIDDDYVFNHGRTQIFGGYQFSHYFADPNRDTRAAHQFTIGVAHQLSAKLIGQLFYAFRFSDFTEASRSDVRHVLGAAAIYSISENLSGSLVGTFVENNSTVDSLYSYQALNVTLGLTWSF